MRPLGFCIVFIGIMKYTVLMCTSVILKVTVMGLKSLQQELNKPSQPASLGERSEVLKKHHINLYFKLLEKQEQTKANFSRK